MTPLRIAVLLLACFVFTAAAGPGVCKPGQHGTTKFKFFIAELQSDHIAGAWRFNPLLNASAGTFQLTGATVSLDSGQPTTLQNTGGETHLHQGRDFRRRIHSATQSVVGKSGSGS